MRSTFSACLLLVVGCFLAPGEDTLSVSGVVLSESGAPIPDASVALLYRAPFTSWSDGVEIGVANTNSEGRYVIVLGPPRTHSTANCGSLLVSVQAPGYIQPIPQGIGSTVEGTCEEGTVEVTPILMSTVDP